MTKAIETAFFEDIIDDIARKQEIKTLAQLLAQFDLTFGMLVDGSPRQARTREEAQRAALIIAQDQALSSYLMDKGMLPHKILEEQYHVNRNILIDIEKYIIATVLIHINDLGYLKPYVLPQPRRGENGSNQRRSNGIQRWAGNHHDTQGNFERIKTKKPLEVGDITETRLHAEALCHDSSPVIGSYSRYQDFFAVRAYAQVSSSLELGVNRWNRVVMVRPLDAKGATILRSRI